MYSLDVSTEEFRKIDGACRAVLSKLVADVPKKRESFKISSDKSLFAEDPGKEIFYILREGNVRCERDGKLLFVLEAGDMIGFERICLNESGIRFGADLAVVVDEYYAADFFEVLRWDRERFDLWNRYVTLRMELYALMLGSMTRREVDLSPDVRSYEAGDVIFSQGSDGTEVYTMLSGVAEVFVGGMKVGEVYEDEIFGATAALTGTPRTATVKALTPCTVVVASRENFRELIEVHPDTAMKLVEDMKRVIVSTNRKIIELAGEDGRCSADNGR